MNIDHKLSHALFHLAQSHWTLRHVAILAGTHLIWLMLGVLVAVSAWDSEARVFAPGLVTLLLFVFLLPAWGVTMLLSKFVNRERPFEELREKPLIAPFVRTASFPSAHATFAFSMVALALLTPVSTLSSYLLAGAAIVALGRVAAGLHFFSDVLVGAIVGFGVTPYAIAIIMVALGYD